jgi:hypothetical protein
MFLGLMGEYFRQGAIPLHPLRQGGQIASNDLDNQEIKMLALRLLQTACAHLMIQRMLGSILSAAQEFGLFIRLSQRLTKRLVPLLRSAENPHQLQKRGLMETGWHPRKKHMRVPLTSVYINRCQSFGTC